MDSFVHILESKGHVKFVLFNVMFVSTVYYTALTALTSQGRGHWENKWIAIKEKQNLSFVTLLTLCSISILGFGDVMAMIQRGDRPSG